MEKPIRTSYGRPHTPYRQNRRPYRAEAQPADYWETFLAQCVVCGMILACLLLMHVVDLPITQGLRGNLKEALGQHADPAQVSDLWASVQNIRGTLQNMLDDKQNMANEEGRTAVSQPQVQEQAQNQAVDTPGGLESVRIDEDILADITAREAFEEEVLSQPMSALGEPQTE